MNCILKSGRLKTDTKSKLGFVSILNYQRTFIADVQRFNCTVFEKKLRVPICQCSICCVN